MMIILKQPGILWTPGTPLKSSRLCDVGDRDVFQGFSSLRPPQKGSGVSSVAAVADYPIGGIHHVTVGPNDGIPSGHPLQRGIKGTVKPGRHIHLPLRRMVGKYQVQRYCRISFLYTLYSRYRQGIKLSPISHIEIIDSEFQIVSLYGFFQAGQYLRRCGRVSKQKTSHKITSPFCAYNTSVVLDYFITCYLYLQYRCT